MFVNYLACFYATSLFANVNLSGTQMYKSGALTLLDIQHLNEQHYADDQKFEAICFHHEFYSEAPLAGSVYKLDSQSFAWLMAFCFAIMKFHHIAMDEIMCLFTLLYHCLLPQEPRAPVHKGSSNRRRRRVRFASPIASSELKRPEKIAAQRIVYRVTHPYNPLVKLFGKIRDAPARDLTEYHGKGPQYPSDEKNECCESKDNDEMQTSREVLDTQLYDWKIHRARNGARFDKPFDFTSICSNKCLDFKTIKTESDVKEACNAYIRIYMEFLRRFRDINYGRDGLCRIHGIADARLAEINALHRYKIKFLKKEWLYENRTGPSKKKICTRYPNYDNYVEHIEKSNAIPVKLQDRVIYFKLVCRHVVKSCKIPTYLTMFKDTDKVCRLACRARKDGFIASNDSKMALEQKYNIIRNNVRDIIRDSEKLEKMIDYNCTIFMEIYEYWELWAAKQAKWLELKKNYLGEKELDKALESELRLAGKK